MNESQFFEALGRKQVVIEAQDAEYTRVLSILAAVVSGEITADRVRVDLISRTWAVGAPPAPTEG